MKPNKFGVVIIQFLGKEDEKTGQILYDATLKYKKFQKSALMTDFYDVHSKIEFIQILETLIQRIKDENYFFILHIETHGNRFEGLGSCYQELITWEEFFYYTRQINMLYDGTLLLMMALCHGNSAIRAIKIDERSPFKCIIGSFQKLKAIDVLRGFDAFYDTYFFEFNISNALEAMNNELDYNPPIWLITDEYCFEQISFPKHDNRIFWMLLCNEVMGYYTKYPNTELPLSEIATKIDNHLQDEFERSQRYKDFFLFRSKISNT